MHKLILILIMMMSTIFVGCETISQIQTGCFGYEVDSGLKRGTREANRNFTKPYRQCVEETAPHKNTEKKPYG